MKTKQIDLTIKNRVRTKARKTIIYYYPGTVKLYINNYE